jgi:hypothetical protein
VLLHARGIDRRTLVCNIALSLLLVYRLRAACSRLLRYPARRRMMVVCYFLQLDAQDNSGRTPLHSAAVSLA